MRRLRRRNLGISAALTQLVWTAAARPPVVAAAASSLPSLSLAVSPASVRQGRTLLVSVDVSDAPAGAFAVWATFGRVGAEATAALRPLPAGATQFLALVGIEVDAAIGEWKVAVGLRDDLGFEVVCGIASVDLIDGGFSVQRIGFPAEQMSLLEPEVGELERLTMATVFAASASETGDQAPRWTGVFKQPVSGRLVTRHGARRDYLDPAGRVVQESQHGGIDLAAPHGTPIAAAADGVVAFVGRWSIRGNVVVLNHGAGVHTVHAHALDFAVKTGEPVVAGQVLGRVGSTGLSTGPHLHWEVRVNGVGVDPLEWTERAFP